VRGCVSGYQKRMKSPFSDPLAFWAGALLRLGLVLALVAVAPTAIDILFLKGAAIVLATMALYMLAPLAVISLVAGAGLWVADKLRK
jgi:hypothetical protein